MRKSLGLVFIFLVLMVFLPGSSFADMCGCMSGMGGDMPMGCGMMGGMEHQGMGMMGHMGGMRGEGRMHEMMMDDDHPMWRHLHGLGLDEKQKAEVREIRNRVMKETVKKRAEAQIARIELKELLDKDPIDMKAVEAKLRQIETLETDMRLSLIKAREEVKSKLTPEQRKKMREMMEPGHMMGGMGMMEGKCGMMGEKMHHEMDEPTKCPYEEKEEQPAGHMHH
ncbi:MAG TPA: periplasmic heavy metal sensor [Thermodesulfovibrionales bacterium]|nr:periplasmic heavy metal sensor [Thermodesulfovibrionales bacterium]